MKKVLAICCLLLAALPSFAQRALGAWQAYLSHNRVNGIVRQADRLYSITSGGLFSLDLSDQSIETYSPVEGLSDVRPTALHYNPNSDLVFVGYEDGMIDYFSDPAEIAYLTDIQRSTIYPVRRINAMESTSDRLYVGTEFGLVIYDLNTLLPVTDVSQFGENPTRLPVQDVALFEGRIWVVVQNAGLYSAPAGFPNLRDPSIWQAEQGRDSLPATPLVASLAANSQVLYASTDSVVYARTAGSWSRFEPLSGPLLDQLFVTETAVAGLRGSNVRVHYSSGRNLNFFNPDFTSTILLDQEEGVVYIGTNSLSLLRFEEFAYESLGPEGPRTNDCFRVAANNGEFYIAPGGYNQAFTPNQSALGIYYFSPESGWRNLNRDNGTLPNEVSSGFARAHYRQGTDLAYLGSFGSGMLVLQRGQVVQTYTCDNSGLSPVVVPCRVDLRDQVRVSGIDFDSQGNLWATTDFGFNPLTMQRPDSSWQQVSRFIFPTGHHLTEMLVDEFDNVWMINQSASLLVYPTNGTPADLSDDGTLITLRANTGQGNLPNNNVNCLAEDQDGFIWVGTADGVTVFFDPFSLSQRRIVDANPPFLDGFRLLRDVGVNDIEVDGGNRKWIATNDGVFLVNENGDEVLERFTHEDSPLLSNLVRDVEVDPTTGEVFFVTDKGLISYQGDATAGATPCDIVQVFPNPVFTDYSGMVTIRGSAADSKVKITTLSGRLIREIPTQGGTAVWDGTDVQGRRVGSGIYLAMIADNDGENACIGKFAVVER